MPLADLLPRLQVVDDARDLARRVSDELDAVDVVLAEISLAIRGDEIAPAVVPLHSQLATLDGEAKIEALEAVGAGRVLEFGERHRHELQIRRLVVFAERMFALADAALRRLLDVVDDVL